MNKEKEALGQRGWMQNSWEQREQFYFAGGTGCWGWGWGDQTTIRWRDEDEIKDSKGDLTRRYA